MTFPSLPATNYRVPTCGGPLWPGTPFQAGLITLYHPGSGSGYRLSFYCPSGQFAPFGVLDRGQLGPYVGGHALGQNWIVEQVVGGLGSRCVGGYTE